MVFILSDRCDIETVDMRDFTLMQQFIAMQQDSWGRKVLLRYKYIGCNHEVYTHVLLLYKWMFNYKLIVSILTCLCSSIYGQTFHTNITHVRQ